MKNILVFFTFKYDLKLWHSSGILEREINYYYKIAKNYGHRFSFITYGDKNDLRYLDPKFHKFIKIIPIFKKKPQSSFVMFFLSILFISNKRNLFNSYDLYKTNQNHGGWLAVIAKLIYKKKLISRSGYDLFHFSLKKNNIIKIILSYIICFINYRFADQILIPTLFYKKFIQKYFFINEEKINIVGNYVDLNLFKFKERNYLKSKYKFCFIGRLEKQKNLIQLIEVFKKNTKDSLSIYGTGSLKDKIVKNIENNSSINLINKKFNHKDIPDIFYKYDFFILPSDYEGCPKILLEAMSTGLIPIVKKIDNNDEIIIDQISGFFINNSNTSFFLPNNLKKSELQFISKNSHEIIKKKFNINTLIQIENQIYLNFDK